MSPVRDIPIAGNHSYETNPKQCLVLYYPTHPRAQQRFGIGKRDTSFNMIPLK